MILGIKQVVMITSRQSEVLVFIYIFLLSVSSYSGDLLAGIDRLKEEFPKIEGQSSQRTINSRRRSFFQKLTPILSTMSKFNNSNSSLASVQFGQLPSPLCSDTGSRRIVGRVSSRRLATDSNLDIQAIVQDRNDQIARMEKVIVNSRNSKEHRKLIKELQKTNPELYKYIYKSDEEKLTKDLHSEFYAAYDSSRLIRQGVFLADVHKRDQVLVGIAIKAILSNIRPIRETTPSCTSCLCPGSRKTNCEQDEMGVDKSKYTIDLSNPIVRHLFDSFPEARSKHNRSKHKEGYELSNEMIRKINGLILGLKTAPKNIANDKVDSYETIFDHKLSRVIFSFIGIFVYDDSILSSHMSETPSVTESNIFEPSSILEQTNSQRFNHAVNIADKTKNSFSEKILDINTEEELIQRFEVLFERSKFSLSKIAGRAAYDLANQSIRELREMEMPKKK
ncbi:hypothetical protein OAB57_00070 [Bacteriovoracaceae bacterium]|nr:hypothetical protein [Bacteriovoracaceae bacterium]